MAVVVPALSHGLALGLWTVNSSDVKVSRSLRIEAWPKAMAVVVVVVGVMGLL